MILKACEEEYFDGKMSEHSNMPKMKLSSNIFDYVGETIKQTLRKHKKL